MAIIKFVGNWCTHYQNGVPKGYLCIKPKDTYINNIGKALNKLNDIQFKKNELKDLDIKIEIHYKKRTLDQNALMWSLYTIEANEHNAGMSGDKSQNVTTQELYENDLIEHAPVVKLQCSKDFLGVLKSEYKVIGEQEENNKIIVTALITTSKFNTKQMAEWIDRIFNRLVYNGISVTNPVDIQDYWLKWRESLNKNKIFLHDNNTDQEYKNNNPICEACGEYIGDGSGHLAHIKSRGAGGKDHPDNYLHLCVKCHLGIQHANGFKELIKKYTHLSNKVGLALGGDFFKKKEKIKDIFEGEEVEK
jgi:hypothetical protein